VLLERLPLDARRARRSVVRRRSLSDRTVSALETTPDDVLAFWFGAPATEEDALMVKVRRWFSGGTAMDAEVRQRFASTVEAALTGQLDAWADTLRGRLALILVVDQFTRNVFRDDPKTYAGDTKAQQLAVDALDQGLDRELSPPESMFLSMPLLHAEDLALQHRVAAIIQRNAAAAPPLYAKMCAMQVEQAAKYTDIIARFGRFPHRNAILGRVSTDEETRFLEDWASKAAPTGASERQ
jgi:uncharacterized protein (DUF924 family)